MPRYFFNIIYGIDIIDETGTELPDLKSIRLMAIRSSGEATSELGEAFWQQGERREVNVTDETPLTSCGSNFPPTVCRGGRTTLELPRPPSGSIASVTLVPPPAAGHS